MSYFVYILRCADATYYTGYTDNVAKRLAAHNAGKGAKYTQGRVPCILVYRESFEDKSGALKREWQSKHKMTRAQKEELIRAYEENSLQNYKKVL